jgi:hypothetical protein
MPAGMLAAAPTQDPRKTARDYGAVHVPRDDEETTSGGLW